MGVVYQAQDTKLDRTVALKFLASHLVQDGELRKRFEREAKAAAALNHPNICHVYSIDEFEGKTFIAMAFLEGQTLDKKIEDLTTNRVRQRFPNALERIGPRRARGSLAQASSSSLVHRPR